MIERQVNVRTVMVYADCECGGELKATGEAYMTYPPKYIHVCDKCQDIQAFRISYPTQRYVAE